MIKPTVRRRESDLSSAGETYQGGRFCEHCGQQQDAHVGKSRWCPMPKAAEAAADVKLEELEHIAA